jgi:hypothetical protein
MTRIMFRLLVALACAALASESRAAGKKATPSDEVPLPEPAEVTNLEVHPAKFTLRGSDSAQQLIVTANLVGRRLADVTSGADYDLGGAKTVRILRGGRVIPLASGETEILVRYGSHTARVPVETESIEEELPINFANEIVPIFSKLGCNAGGCHGKASGQNGFKLSLAGFDPPADYVALVKEGRGRRVFPGAPDSSLLLLKTSGGVAHGGGKRMEVGSDEYRTLRRWIAAGLPYGQPDDPVVTRISIFPQQRELTRQNHQQLAVYAHYSNGAVEDVTRRAQFDSNDQEIAVVDGNGLVRTLAASGEAAVMCRYQGQVATFRAMVPLGVATPEYTFEPKTVVDTQTLAKWKQLGIVPSELCSDAEFIRRACLDVTGTLPTPKQVLAFVEDNSTDKREKLIDRLLETPEYSAYFANKWADILRVKRGNQPNRAQGTFLFHEWIREAIAADKPYDGFAGDILTAVGEETKAPPTVWYKDIQTADQFVDNVSQVFLGTRLQCAQCHHHPYEKWTQDDYWGLAAFYGRVAVKTLQTPGVGVQNQQNQRRILYARATGNVINKRTNAQAVIKALDGDPVQPDGDLDPRQKLVEWMVDAKNPFFARAVANRYWAHFFGRGVVDPVDDMRVTNPPSNPALLDALAADLVKNGYSLKHLIGTICKSRTYSLSSTPNEFNKTDRQAYSRYYPKRMAAEVLYDAVSQVTGSPAQFPGLPQDAHAPNRALMLPDESFQSYFLDVFGRPQRLSACECERSTEANLAQSLHLLNSEEVQGKIARSGGRSDQLAKDPRSDEEKIEELFLWAVGHKPSEKHLRLAMANIDANAKNKKLAYENILWALLNTKEFVFNR